jgi:micrococcal nuclease
MKLIIIIIILTVSFSLYAKEKSYGEVKVLEVTSIYDGDTFRTNIKGYPRYCWRTHEYSY